MYFPYHCISNTPSHWSLLIRPTFLLFFSYLNSTSIPITQLLVIWLLLTTFHLIVLLSLDSYWLLYSDFIAISPFSRFLIQFQVFLTFPSDNSQDLHFDKYRSITTL